MPTSLFAKKHGATLANFHLLPPTVQPPHPAAATFSPVGEKRLEAGRSLSLPFAP